MTRPSLCALARRAGLRERPLLLVLGGPGSGKGVISEQLCSNFGWHSVSAGALLRAASDDNARLRALLQAGRVVPAALSTRIVLEYLSKVNRTALVDGFPRCAEGASLWTKVISAAEALPPRVLVLKADEHVVRNRLKTRGRMDDEDEIVYERLRHERMHGERVLEMLRNVRGALVKVVDANGTPQDVWARIESVAREECTWLRDIDMIG